MFATYCPSFYRTNTPKPNRPISIHKTLYGARQAAKAHGLHVGRLVPEQTCRHHSGATPARRLSFGVDMLR